MFSVDFMQQGWGEIPDFLRTPEAQSRANLWSWSRMTLWIKVQSSPRFMGNPDCFLKPWTGFQTGPKHHMFHVTHRVCGYSCLEMGPVFYRRVNKGPIMVEPSQPKLGICLCGERWTARGPLQDHMGWRWGWEEETVFLQFLVINSVHIYHAGLFCSLRATNMCSLGAATSSDL